MVKNRAKVGESIFYCDFSEFWQTGPQNHVSVVAAPAVCESAFPEASRHCISPMCVTFSFMAQNSTPLLFEFVFLSSSVRTPADGKESPSVCMHVHACECVRQHTWAERARLGGQTWKWALCGSSAFPWPGLGCTAPLTIRGWKDSLAVCPETQILVSNKLPCHKLRVRTHRRLSCTFPECLAAPKPQKRDTQGSVYYLAPVSDLRRKVQGWWRQSWLAAEPWALVSRVLVQRSLHHTTRLHKNHSIDKWRRDSV